MGLVYDIWLVCIKGGLGLWAMIHKTGFYIWAMTHMPTFLLKSLGTAYRASTLQGPAMFKTSGKKRESDLVGKVTEQGLIGD